jgi:hypothetical protein
VPRRSSKASAHAGIEAGVIGRHPRESVGLLVLAAAIMLIFVNALFMQHGPHPAPIFAYKPKAAPARHVSPQHAAIPSPAPRPHVGAPAEPRRNDPIARLLAPSDRVLAVQRVLTQYGFGQIRPTGIVGPETVEAIKRFERSRNLPVTGEMSARVVQALANLSGHPLD